MELVGLFLPIVIDLINRKVADSDKRFWVSVAFCAVAGAFVNFLDTGFAFADPKTAVASLGASIGSVFTLAQISYKAVWEKAQPRKDFKLEGGSDV